MLFLRSAGAYAKTGQLGPVLNVRSAWACAETMVSWGLALIGVFAITIEHYVITAKNALIIVYLVKFNTDL